MCERERILHVSTRTGLAKGQVADAEGTDKFTYEVIIAPMVAEDEWLHASGPRGRYNNTVSWLYGDKKEGTGL